MKKQRKIWTQAQTKALITNIMSGTTDNEELGKMIGRNTNEVYNKRRGLGLIENNRPIYDHVEVQKVGRRWTPQDDEILNEMVSEGKSDKEIAHLLGRTIIAIQTRRNKPPKENQTLFTPEMEEPQKEEPKMGLEQGKYTRVEGYTREVSLLWGMIKYTKR
jgi:hypothetical protein